MIMHTFFAFFGLKCWVFPSLMLSTSMIINDADMVCADSQRTNAGDVKKMTITPKPQLLNEHAHHIFGLCIEKLNFPLFDGVSLCDY